MNRKQTARKSTSAWWAPFVDRAKPEEVSDEGPLEETSGSAANHKQTARKSTTPRLPAPGRDPAKLQ